MINTYKEYMQELRRALADFDPDFSAELLEDFETHFTEGIESGMTEEQICRELGSVESVIAELKDDFRASSPDIPKVTGIRPGSSSASQQPVTQIRIRLFTASVSLQGGNVPDVLCDYNRDDFSEKFEMYTEGNTLVLREKPLSLFRRLGIARTDGRFSFTVPSSVNDLDISDTNGKIHLENLSVSSACVNTVNSKISAEHFSAGTCDFHCVNGRIHLEDSKVQTLKASSVNGPVYVSGTCEVLELHSANGSLQGRAEVKKGISLSAVNGSASVHYKKAPGGAEIDLSSNCGNISAFFNDTHLNSRKNLRTAYGDRELNITVHTQNGSIRLQEVANLSGQE